MIDMSNWKSGSPHGRGYPPVLSMWRNTKYHMYRAFPGEKGPRCFCLDHNMNKKYDGNLVCVAPNKCGMCIVQRDCLSCEPNNKCKKLTN